MTPALLLAFLSGFVALSYEILWFRAFNFASGSRADTFGLMLGAYLTGLALGSLAVRRYCRVLDAQGRDELVGSIFILTLCANIAGFFVVPLLAWTLSQGLAWEYGLAGVGLSAAALGAVFPLIIHAWIPPDENVGRHVSWIYLSNILGSSCGSLLTGFLLLDHLSLAATHVLLFFLALGMAGVLAFLRRGRGRLASAAVILVLALINGAFGRDPFFDVYEKLQEKLGYTPGRRFVHVVETKSGVITVNDRDQIFGGGVYDGAYNTSLEDNRNSILRCYALAGMHAAPRDVLMIGLSSGSWGTVIANNPEVKRFTIVEINAGYLQLIPKYPAVAGLLKDARVDVVIDDGRRWMIRNPDRKFDMIVANATINWRANSTNLLSKEFLDLVRTRLKPGGLYFYNTTESARVVRTGCEMFPHALKIGSFLAVSDAPLVLDPDRLKNLLFDYPLDKGTVLNRADPRDVVTMDHSMMSLRRMVRTREKLLSSLAAARMVTDDNMGTEWDKVLEMTD